MGIFACLWRKVYKDYQNLAATTLNLGTVQWDRDDGIYWLQISVTAEELEKSVDFTLNLSGI
jgi:hypothetical protein